MSAELRTALSDAVMRDVLVILPPPDGFAAYADAVRERLIAALAVDVEYPFVVRQFEGQAWVQLREAARQHAAIEEASLTIAGLRNALLFVERNTGTETNCPLEGVHEHAFRGPHRFREREPGT